MKKNGFKLFLTVFSIFVFLLAGCSSSSESSGGSEDEREVNILYIGDPEFWENQAKEFEEETGIEVNYESVPFGQLHDNMFTVFSGGSSDYDVVHVRDDWATEFASMGFLEPLDEYVTEELKSEFPESSFEALSHDGSLYGFPRYTWLWQYYYNKDVFTQAGIENVPETWDELVETSKIIQEEVDGMYGYAEAYGQRFAVTPFIVHLRAEGGQFWDYEKDLPKFNSSEGVNALQFMQDMNLKHKVLHPLSFEFSGTGPLAEVFAQGQFAMSVATPNIPLMSNDPAISKVTGQIEAALIPGSADKSAGYAETGGMAIPANSKNKDEAFEFIKFATSAEQEKKMALETGNIPLNLTALNDSEVIEKYPHFGFVDEQLKYTKGLFKHEKTTEIQDEVARFVVEAVNGKKSPEDALKEAEESVLKILNK